MITVVVLSERLGAVLPAAALPALRTAEAVYAGEGVPLEFWSALGVDGPAPAVVEAGAVVIATSADAYPDAHVITTPEPLGAGLLDAAAVMHRLRSPGGCPWDAEQTHDSLRQYLVEETFELLEAIEDGDRAAMREELGDVLLQVLFHARVAAEAAEDPFDIDAVASELVAKLVGRHPHVFEGNDPAVHDATSQQHRWEELKQAEKRRESSVDGVALGQPAVALAAKLVQRTKRAGFPVDLLPEGDDTGTTLFAVSALAKLAGEDPETELRQVCRRFAANVREAEAKARAEGLDSLAAEDWRRFLPS
ncbi:XTP/dITP diphosphohydrolase [Lentzea albidocapillata subsp. violacea]|uniref:XTP/dITP diphosphohydrolase n=1 Tax=Lentzea albidocapillata subsp. violacea TaxID=128104 RepID=A0A1G9GD35_9PSEU|nr:MazG family protein [Lentzea albidocapillata]SDK98550.1 XTP/dITP diphosphohydrolase [Lentzea albidocapillata subsp. violacea]